MPKDSDKQSDPKKAMAEALRRALKNKAASQPHNDIPGSDFSAKGGKGSKLAAPKARNFRHQGR
jgi:hypothetical protein